MSHHESDEEEDHGDEQDYADGRPPVLLDVIFVLPLSDTHRCLPFRLHHARNQERHSSKLPTMTLSPLV